MTRLALGLHDFLIYNCRENRENELIGRGNISEIISQKLQYITTYSKPLVCGGDSIEMDVFSSKFRGRYICHILPKHFNSRFPIIANVSLFILESGAPKFVL